MNSRLPRFVATSIALILLLGVTVAPASADDPPPRRPLHDIGHGVSLIAQDAWALVTGPTRWTRDDLVELGGILAVGGVLFAFDPEIERFAQRNENEPFFDETRRLGDQFGRLGLMGKTWPYYGGAIVLGYATNQRKIMRMGAQILEAQYLRGVDARTRAKVPTISSSTAERRSRADTRQACGASPRSPLYTSIAGGRPQPCTRSRPRSACSASTGARTGRAMCGSGR